MRGSITQISGTGNRGGASGGHYMIQGRSMAEFQISESMGTLSGDTQKLKEEIRPYFEKIDCSLRVLGSQFGLEPSELTDLERQSAQNLRQLLLNKCFSKEKITSMEQFASVLDKPALKQYGIARDIRKRFGPSRQFSMDSTTSSIQSMASCMSPTQSFTSSMEASFSSSTEVKTGSMYIIDL